MRFLNIRHSEGEEDANEEKENVGEKADGSNDGVVGGELESVQPRHRDAGKRHAHHERADRVKGLGLQNIEAPQAPAERDEDNEGENLGEIFVHGKSRNDEFG